MMGSKAYTIWTFLNSDIILIWIWDFFCGNHKIVLPLVYPLTISSPQVRLLGCHFWSYEDQFWRSNWLEKAFFRGERLKIHVGRHVIKNGHMAGSQSPVFLLPFIRLIWRVNRTATTQVTVWSEGPGPSGQAILILYYISRAIVIDNKYNHGFCESNRDRILYFKFVLISIIFQVQLRSAGQVQGFI